LISAASCSMPCLVRLASDLFKFDQTASTGFSSSRHAAMAASSRSAAGGPGPGRSSQSGAAAHPVRPACTRSRTAHAPARRSGPASSTDPASPRPPARHPAPPPARAAEPGTACTGSRPPLSRPAPASRRPPASAVTGSPTSATPGTVSRPPGRSRPPRSAPPRPAAPVPGGPAHARSARHHLGTSSFRHSARRAALPELVTPAFEDLLVHPQVVERRLRLTVGHRDRVTEVTGVGQAGPAPQTGGRERRWVPTIRRGRRRSGPGPLWRT
jgi:hypothetical protein